MNKAVRPSQRGAILEAKRREKMARSPHRYVRGSTAGFYAWLDQAERISLPEGPAIWICGDCHVGNIGPLSDANGNITIQIRDLDQTVIGNPANDILRLGLSLASAARGSNLPGVVTARMLESLMAGYENAFDHAFDEMEDLPMPRAVKMALNQSRLANWRTLARERLKNPRPVLPLGERYWPLSRDEARMVKELFEHGQIPELVRRLRHRDHDARVKLLDAAYWMKGCSSLGLLRLAILVELKSKKDGSDYCIVDVKEAIKAIAPPEAEKKMPRENGKRVLEGARHLSPALGGRMTAARIMGKSVFIRELLPQDLKLDVETLSPKEAEKVARFLGAVVGRAHARQMSNDQRAQWLAELQRHHPRNIDTPAWLWVGVVDLLARHEQAYLEHCRRYAVK